MPGLPESAEKEALAKKMSSYGKTWHPGKRGEDGKSGDKAPLGEPMLAWSCNTDGEIKPEMQKSLERRLGGGDAGAARRSRPAGQASTLAFPLLQKLTLR